MDIFKQSERIIKELERITIFEKQYNLSLNNQSEKLLADAIELEKQLKETKPKNQEQLINSELKRQLNGHIFLIDKKINPKNEDYETIIKKNSIPEQDIEELKPWLQENKRKIEEITQKLYEKGKIIQKLKVPIDILDIRDQANNFSKEHIKKYHEAISKIFEKKTNVGKIFSKLEPCASLENTAYYDYDSKILAMPILVICNFSKKHELSLNEINLIKYYGHEGMHTLNDSLTQESKLPYFLKRDTFFTSATAESVAQFYENMIFEKINNSPETQKELGIQEKFEEIYEEAKNQQQLNEYRNKFYQYSITVLADKKFGPQQEPETLMKKIQALLEVAIDKSLCYYLIEKNRYSFDSEGNLDVELLEELRYCAKPVERALAEFEKQGITYSNNRSLIDTTFLTGFWTPKGFVDNARLTAKSNKP